MVENKDGNSVIRCEVQVVPHVTQLDEFSTHLEYGFHINFGGHLPKAIVLAFIIPDMTRVISMLQADLGYSTNLSDLNKKDGKLLGELFTNQIKFARKKGGCKKNAALGKAGVDEFLYLSAAMVSLPYLATRG